MEGAVNAGDIMTRAAVSVDLDLPLAEVARLMLDRGVSAVCVVGCGGKLIGMVSERDLLRRAQIKTDEKRPWWLRLVAGNNALTSECVKCRGRKVREVMTGRPVSITEDAALDEIISILEVHNIKRVPVVRDGRVVGIVSRANLLRAFAAESAHKPSDVPTDDRTIRMRLLNELGKQPWWHGREEEIVVAGGIVHLWGTVHGDLEKHALYVAAEHTPGVKAVRSHVSVRGR
jgi:CBS domain-containing protein